MRLARSERRDAWMIALALASAWGATWLVQSRAWRADPEYVYGWAVPLLVAFLASERWFARPSAEPGLRAWWGLVAVGPLAWLPARVAMEPFPMWPAMLWLHSLGTVATTLGVAGLLGGRRWVRHFAFPALFSLTALPWPGIMHREIVQGLMGVVAAFAATIVDALGSPARAVGNVIELGRGWVGVEEACSGIRSLQATLMAALFLGEYFQTSAARRWQLVAVGVASAFATNVGRTVALTLQTARYGIEAAASWHNAAGYVVLAINIGVLGVVAWHWSRNSSVPAARRNDATAFSGRSEDARSIGAPNRNNLVGRTDGEVSVGATHGCASFPSLRASLALLIAVLACEIAPRAWFAVRSQADVRASEWTVRWPVRAFDMQELPVTAPTRRMLQCDWIEARRWRNELGARRAAFFIRWDHASVGRTAAVAHGPEICLPLAGSRLTAEWPAHMVLTPAGALWFRTLEFANETGPFVVFHCVWSRHEPSAAEQIPANSQARTWWRDRWREIQRGHLGPTQVLTVAFWDDGAGAEWINRRNGEIAALIDTDGRHTVP